MILLLGDIHGNFNHLKHIIESKQINDCHIIQVGDFGIGFNYSITNNKMILKDLNEFLAEKNIIMYAIRGNHDNPSYFKKEFHDKHDLHYSNVKLIEDYTVLELDGQRILCVGGAVSIDRESRQYEDYEYLKMGLIRDSWWKDEVFNYDEDKIKDLRNIDIVITHSSPAEVLPINSIMNENMSHGYIVEKFAENDTTLKNDLNTERRNISKLMLTLLENNNIKTWYYGHFHNSKNQTYKNINFILLGINELYEDKTDLK